MTEVGNREDLDPWTYNFNSRIRKSDFSNLRLVSWYPVIGIMHRPQLPNCQRWSQVHLSPVTSTKHFVTPVRPLRESEITLVDHKFNLEVGGVLLSKFFLTAVEAANLKVVKVKITVVTMPFFKYMY